MAHLATAAAQGVGAGGHGLTTPPPAESPAAAADVLPLLIGPRWLARADDGEDPVEAARSEVADALRAELRLPVLVDGAAPVVHGGSDGDGASGLPNPWRHGRTVARLGKSRVKVAGRMPWLGCFTIRGLLAPLGHVPPAECEARYSEQAKIA